MEGSTSPNSQHQAPIEVHMHPQQSARYCNNVQVLVTDEAVVLRLLYVQPDAARAILLDEVALSPQHALRLSRTIQHTVSTHFTRYLSAQDDPPQGGASEV